MDTFRRIGTFASAVSLCVAIETDGNEIFNKEPCIGKTFHVFFCRGCDLSFGRTKVSKLIQDAVIG
jgi:hypothetical protein